MKTWIYTQVLLHCVVLHYAVTFFVFKEEDLPEMPEGICFEYLTWKCLVCFLSNVVLHHLLYAFLFIKPVLLFPVHITSTLIFKEDFSALLLKIVPVPHLIYCFSFLWSLSSFILKLPCKSSCI